MSKNVKQYLISCPTLVLRYVSLNILSKKAFTLRVIFSKVQTGVIHQCHRFCSNSAQCDLLSIQMHWQIFPSPFSLVFEISLLKGGPEGLKNWNALKCSKFEILFFLAYRMYQGRVGSCN